MTDTDFLFDVLKDGDWHAQAEILARSMVERGCGLTVHSRAADLRKRGHKVETHLERNGNGRTLSFYRLITLDEAAVASDRCGTDTAATASSSVPATPEPSTAEGAAHAPDAAASGTLLLFDPPARGAYGNEAA